MLTSRYGTSKFRTLIVNEFGDGSDWKLPVIWEWVVKIIIPLELILLLVWWIVNSVLDKTRLWYIITQESLSSALLQVLYLETVGFSYGLATHKL